MLLYDANHVTWYLYFFDAFLSIFENSHVKLIILYIINWGLQFKLTSSLQGNHKSYMGRRCDNFIPR